MNEKEFIDKYLWPSADRLDRTFTHPLPKIPGLKKAGDFIVQCEHEDTFSTNIMTKYVSDTLQVRLVETYKCTQNKVTGVFVRLVGTMTLVKPGYHFLLLDASIRNVDMLTGNREDAATRVAIHLPQADAEQRKILFSHLNEQAEAAGISYREVKLEQSPAFWGSMWRGESPGIHLDMIKRLRDIAWDGYERVIQQTRGKSPFDYTPVQRQMVFEAAIREHLTFKKMGLSVPVESQAAFFAVQVCGV
jgi:hypothetical protein